MQNTIRIRFEIHYSEYEFSLQSEQIKSEKSIWKSLKLELFHIENVS